MMEYDPDKKLTMTGYANSQNKDFFRNQKRTTSAIYFNLGLNEYEKVSMQELFKFIVKSGYNIYDHENTDGTVSVWFEENKIVKENE